MQDSLQAEWSVWRGKSLFELCTLEKRGNMPEVVGLFHSAPCSDAFMHQFSQLAKAWRGEEENHPLLGVSFVPSSEGLRILDLDEDLDIDLLTKTGSVLRQEIWGVLPYIKRPLEGERLKKEHLLGWTPISPIRDEDCGSSRGGLTTVVAIPPHSVAVKARNGISRARFGGSLMFYLTLEDRDIPRRRGEERGTENLRRSGFSHFVRANGGAYVRPFMRPLKAETIHPKFEGMNAVYQAVVAWKPRFEQYCLLGAVWVAAPCLNISLSCPDAVVGELSLT